MADFRTLLVPTDFSEDAAAALDRAIELAAGLGATLHLLHVYHRPIELLSPYGLELPPSVDAEVRGNATLRIEKELARAREAGVEAAAHLQEGVPATGIVAAAEEIGADLIVMGTRGASGFVHVLSGSVAERVARTAPCPVLTLRAASR